MTAPKTWIEVSKEALVSNFEHLVKLGGGAGVLPVIKANAYGHGLLEVAGALDEAGANWFAVDSLEEALGLRKAGFKQRILVLGLIPRAGIEAAIESDISFVLFNEDQLSYIEARRGEGRAKIHVPVETGLYREGFEMEEFKDILERTKSNRGISLEGVQTHFANVEDTSSGEYAERQLAEYEKYLELTNEYNIDSVLRHTGASAASILYSKSHFDLLRPGIALYGLWPSKETKERAEKINPDLQLKPALTWKTVIAELKNVRAGESVGYGLTEMLERDSKIAVLPIGYYDGYDRVGMSSKGEVLINGKRCKIVGRICMNMCMADVTDIPNAKPGDEVVLIGSQRGENVTAEEFARKMESLNYEAVARLGAHIERRLV